MILARCFVPLLVLGLISTSTLAAPIRRDEGSSIESSPYLPAASLLLAPSTGAASATPTSTLLPTTDDPTSPSAVPGTLIFSNPLILALPSSLSALASDPLPSASSTHAISALAQQEEDPFPPTTRDGVVASSLVGAIVALGLMGVVWCLVRARYRRRAMKRERTLQDETEGKDGAGLEATEGNFVIGSEDGSDGSSLRSNEEVLDEQGEKPDEGDMINIARLSKHQGQDLDPSPSVPPSKPPTISLASPSSTQDAASEPSQREERLRTITTDTCTSSVDSYYTSPAVSPAPMMNPNWGAAATLNTGATMRPGTTDSLRGSGMGRAI